MPTQNTFQRVVLGLSRGLSPLGGATGSLDEFANLMLTELGWDVNSIPQPVQDLAAQIDSLLTLTQGIGDTDGIEYAKLAEISSAVVKLIDGIRNIANGSNAGLSPELVAENFLQTLPEELLQYLFTEYLRQYQPSWCGVLTVLGILATEQVTSATPARPPHLKRIVNWSHFLDILTKPNEVFQEVYKWGGADLDSFLFLSNVTDFLGVLGLGPFLDTLDNNAAMVLEEKTDAEADLTKYYLSRPFASSDDETASTTFGLGLFPLPQNGAHLPGLALLSYGDASLDVDTRITDNLSFVLRTGFAVAGGLGVVVRPGEEVKVFTGFHGGAGAAAASGAIKVGLRFAKSETGNIRLLTVTEGTFLEIESISVYGGADFSTSQRKDAFLEFELKGGKLVISGEGTDGFLSTILPEDGITGTFSLTVGVSSLRGLYFAGGGGLEIELPVHVQLGPVDVQSITLAALVKDSALVIEAGASIKAALGPLQAAVANMGLSATLMFPGDGGNLGPLDLSLGFKPPTGVGLAVDAGVVKGGGFLDFHSDKGEYSGALELTFANWLSVKAIGLITTRMPDGSEGFSLLILMAAELASGIQLGYGFRLLGVGGLLGLNRTMRLQPLMEGIRTGAVNSIMFPQNVVANAPRILSDLRTIFPPEEGRFLIGPMAKLGWGTPTLVSISLGIVIEIPGNIALLGVLRAALPNDQAPLLVLQANFAAAIEFDKERLYFFAVMYESRVLTMSIDGEMGLLVAWGADANFVVSAGGFHPQFNPPPLPFPSPKRVGVSILNESYARIRASGYFAITSNTAQFGAQAELYFGLSIVSVEGQISFDALLQFSPFYFIIETSGSVSLEVFGMGLFSIHLRFSLEGPAPWRAAGTGSISFFFFSVSADFDVTWGEAVNTTLDQVEALPLLVAEFEKLENWTAELPRSSGVFESLQPPDTEAKEPVLHPAGSLRISQRLMPLTVQIDKLGNQAVSDVRSLSLAADGGPDMPLAIDRPVSESFAMAQFQEMEDASKLSAQAYALQPAGAVFVGRWGRTASSWLVKRIVRYEQIVIDVQFRRFARPLFELSEGLFAHFLKSNAATRSSLSQKERKRLQPFEERIEVRPGRFAVTNESDNRKVAADAAGFQSEALAREYLRQQVKANPRLSGTLQVVPECEVNTAA